VTFIIVWKIARLLVIPKNITKSSKSLVHMKDYLLLIIRFDIDFVFYSFLFILFYFYFYIFSYLNTKSNIISHMIVTYVT